MELGHQAGSEYTEDSQPVDLYLNPAIYRFWQKKFYVQPWAIVYVLKDPCVKPITMALFIQIKFKNILFKG